MLMNPTGFVPSTVSVLFAPLIVLFVTVCVFVAVSTFDGVMIPDKRVI
jgi:hypothetical protein